MATSLYGTGLAAGWVDEYLATYDFHGTSGTAGGNWTELWMEDGTLVPDYVSSHGPTPISTPGFGPYSWFDGSGDLSNWRSGAPSGIGTPCFVAGTQVLVGYDEQGNPITRNIEDIQVGDTVLSKDENDPSGSVEPRQVTAVEVHIVTQVRLLGIEEADGSSELLKTTDEHPFWVIGVGWVKAEDLQVGQQLLTPDGRLASVASTAVEEHPEGITVYNLTVEGDHSFFVSSTSGDEAVWVHNLYKPAPPLSPPSAPPGTQVALPTSTQGGGINPETEGMFWMTVAAYADQLMYNNVGWYHKLADWFNNWVDDLTRPVSNWVDGVINRADRYWSGDDAADAARWNEEAAIWKMRNAALRRQIAEETAKRTAAAVQPAPGGGGVKPPAPPAAPTSMPSDQPDLHHIMTNKNSKSTAAGGPYTPEFEKLAARRGITLEDEINKMLLEGHRGPHPEYNAEVLRRLSEATDGKTGTAFNQAFDDAMAEIKTETETLGTLLNQLATGGGGQ